MFKTILEIGSAFDWISPIAGFIGDMANGPSYTFLIPYDCGHSGRDITKMLKRRGVHSWGHMVVDGTFMITVRQSQARWAQYLLDQAGIPVENHLTDQHANVRRQAISSSDRQGQSESLVDVLREIMDFRIF